LLEQALGTGPGSGKIELQFQQAVGALFRLRQQRWNQ
jgi:hypothetical protein